MKKLVLFAALAAVFGLSLVSCSSGKSKEVIVEKDNTENVQQELSDLSSNVAEDGQQK